MVSFELEILKTHKEGEKYGWIYVLIPAEIAQQINKGVKVAYRVKGKVGDYEGKQMGILPAGEGSYILALNAHMRKSISQSVGEKISLSLALDPEEPLMSAELLEALTYDNVAESFFKSLSKGNQRYFSNWVEMAKTVETKSKRIYMCLEGLSKGMAFGRMINYFKKNPL